MHDAVWGAFIAGVSLWIGLLGAWTGRRIRNAVHLGAETRRRLFSLHLSSLGFAVATLLALVTRHQSIAVAGPVLLLFPAIRVRDPKDGLLDVAEMAFTVLMSALMSVMLLGMVEDAAVALAVVGLLGIELAVWRVLSQQTA